MNVSLRTFTLIHLKIYVVIIDMMCFFLHASLLGIQKVSLPYVMRQQDGLGDFSAVDFLAYISF